MSACLSTPPARDIYRQSPPTLAKSRARYKPHIPTHDQHRPHQTACFLSEPECMHRGHVRIPTHVSN